MNPQTAQGLSVTPVDRILAQRPMMELASSKLSGGDYPNLVDQRHKQFEELVAADSSSTSMSVAAPKGAYVPQKAKTIPMPRYSKASLTQAQPFSIDQTQQTTPLVPILISFIVLLALISGIFVYMRRKTLFKSKLAPELPTNTTNTIQSQPQSLPQQPQPQVYKQSVMKPVMPQYSAPAKSPYAMNISQHISQVHAQKRDTAADTYKERVVVRSELQLRPMSEFSVDSYML